MMRAHRSLLQQAGLDSSENRSILLHPDKDRLAHWRLSEEILKKMDHTESSPTYDFALCLYLYEDMSSALKNWGNAINAYKHHFPDNRPFLEACKELANRQQSGLQGTESISLQELFVRKEGLPSAEATEERFGKILPMTQIFFGLRLREVVTVPKNSEYNRQFALLERAASDHASKGRNVARSVDKGPIDQHVKAAHQRALFRRSQERDALKEVYQSMKSDTEAQEREKVIARTVERVISASGGRTSEAPTKIKVNQWCALLGDPTLAQQYQSIYLVAIEALSKSQVPEEAFVRKFFEIQEKRTARKNSDSRREY
jgi:Skp family chaperone for outer membrane proteins